MLVVAWELPDDAWTLRGFREAAVHRRSVPVHTGTEQGISHWRAEYQRTDYPEALDALVQANVCWLLRLRERGIRPRPLYETGIRYAAECCGEVWRAWPALLLRRVGDCEDLAAARCSELLTRGIPARVHVSVVDEHEGARAYHVQVATRGGIEDPAVLLGDDGSASCDPMGPRGVPCAVGNFGR